MTDVDRIWAGWRLRYIEQAEELSERSECIFCSIPELSDEEGLVVHRDELVYVVLNLYPYGTGHCMVLPYRHVWNLSEATEAEACQIMAVTRRTVSVLDAVYKPQGYNLGANLGRAAGAGIPEHLHMHVLPRWRGDTNFMTTIGAVRMLPEDLADTWRRVRDGFVALGGPSAG